jgi:predicted ATPase
VYIDKFVISTHSPFLLAIEGAKIYDLDACPVDIKNLWELENSKTYFEFFYKNRNKFLN